MNNILYLTGLVSVIIGVSLLVRYMNKNKIKTYMSDGISLDESRVSTLMLSFIVFMGISIWNSIKFGDIPSNILYMTSVLGGYVAGMNIAKGSMPSQSTPRPPSTNHGSQESDPEK